MFKKIKNIRIITRNIFARIRNFFNRQKRKSSVNPENSDQLWSEWLWKGDFLKGMIAVDFHLVWGSLLLKSLESLWGPLWTKRLARGKLKMNRSLNKKPDQKHNNFQHASIHF